MYPHLTHYLAPTPAAPEMAPGPDATAEFHQKLSDPLRWVLKSGVPIFKAHERTDPATGQLIKVDLPKLYRIAANMQRLERDGGVPIRMTLGHTEPGKPETEQPPIGGYYKNARVQPFGPKGEPAVVVDEWLDPQFAPVRKNFPYRSAEYYDDAEQITGVALLTRDPYLDLGVVAYSSDRTPMDYRVDYTSPAQNRPPTMYAWNGRRPTMYHLVLGEFLMWPQVPSPNGAATPQPPFAAVPPGYQYPQNPQPIVPPAPVPTPYAMPGYPAAPGPTVPSQPQAQYGAGRGGQTNYNPALLGALARGGAMGLGSQMMGGFGGGREDSSRYSAPWPGPGQGMSYTPPGYSPHPHPSTGAVYQNAPPRGGYGPRRYADEPGGGPGGPPGGGSPMGPGGDPLQQLQMLLMAAVEVLGQVTGGGGPGGPGGPPPMGPGGPPGAPPEGPFPPDQEDPNAPYSRYRASGGQRSSPGRGAPRGASRSYSHPGEPVIYQTPYGPVDEYGRPVQIPLYPQRPAPTPYGAMPPQSGYPRPPVPTQPVPYGAPPSFPPGTRTISGQPVGYALEKARWDYERTQMNQAIQLLMYERDQADSSACVEAIRRLADIGYQVGEYEVNELKKRTGDDRQIYLDTIATKYQRIGTTPLPPILGDPTPAGADPNANRPATEAEMKAALKISERDPRIDFPTALQYARQGTQPTQYGAAPVNRITAYPQPGYQPQVPVVPPSPQAQGLFNPDDPYNEFGAPSANGHGLPGSW